MAGFQGSVDANLPEQRGGKENMRDHDIDQWLFDNGYGEADMPAVEKCFEALQSRLERGCDDARDGPMPVVSLVPAGSFAMKALAQGEPIKCYAFGTISPETYLEIIWEYLQQMEQFPMTLWVHQVTTTPSLMITIMYNHFEFQLHYHLTSIKVAREVKSQFDLGVTRDSVNPSIQPLNTNTVPETSRALRELRSCQSIARHFGDRLEQRKYFLIRLWAIGRGIMDIKSPESLIKQIPLGSASDPQSLNINAIAKDLLERNPEGKSQGLEGIPEYHNIISIFERLENSTMHQRINNKHYLVIKIVSHSADITSLGHILVTIDGRLQMLKTMISSALEPKIQPVLWPNRMAPSPLKPLSDTSFEDSYVLSFGNVPTKEQDTTILDTANRWLSDFMTHEIRQRIYVSFHTGSGADAFTEDPVLKTCRMIYPLSKLPVPTHLDNSENDERSSHETSKNSKKKQLNDSKQSSSVDDISTSATGKPTLRTARQILNCLRHDAKHDIGAYFIEYIDRHRQKLQQKPASEWTLETTDPSFIPEHRIQYFTRWIDGEREVMWDKVNKIDLISNTGYSDARHGGSSRKVDEQHNVRGGAATKTLPIRTLSSLNGSKPVE